MSDRTSSKAKIDIRQKVLDEFGAEKAVVFEAYAGAGSLFNAVWAKASGYTGCDVVFYRDDRELYVCDCRRLMRCLNLNRYNVFDFDADGDPWEAGIILSARRRLSKGERIAIVVTDRLSPPQGNKVSSDRAAGIWGNRSGGLGKSDPIYELTGQRVIGQAVDDRRHIHKLAVQKLAQRMNAGIDKHWLAEAPGKPSAFLSGFIAVGVGA